MVNGDRAVLIDTGMGQGDLYGALKGILPESVTTIDVLLTQAMATTPPRHTSSQTKRMWSTSTSAQRTKPR